MGQVIVIEGVTGAGKSRTVAALSEHAVRLGWAVHVIDEDVTLGTFLDDLNDPAWRARPRFGGLDTGLHEIERLLSEERVLIVVERFHLSVYALLPRWSLLRSYDQRLRDFGAVQVLLDYHPSLTEARSVLRPDRAEWADAMDRSYGGREAALAAVRRSQARRRHALLLSDLPYLHLDNSPGHWDYCAAAILAYCGQGVQLGIAKEARREDRKWT